MPNCRIVCVWLLISVSFILLIWVSLFASQIIILPVNASRYYTITNAFVVCTLLYCAAALIAICFPFTHLIRKDFFSGHWLPFPLARFTTKFSKSSSSDLSKPLLDRQCQHINFTYSNFRAAKVSAG